MTPEARILAEYREVLLRPVFSFAMGHVEAVLEQIEAGGLLVGAHPLARPLPDPDDEVFLAVALAGPAQYLVTGNPRHCPAKCRKGVRVVFPAEFLRLYREHGQSTAGDHPRLGCGPSHGRQGRWPAANGAEARPVSIAG